MTPPTTSSSAGRPMSIACVTEATVAAGRIVKRLVPDELWELFQRVTPAAPSRPQGGGRRRYGDREVLAAIAFGAASGCTWRQLPPSFDPSGPTAHRRFTEWSTAVGDGDDGLGGRIQPPLVNGANARV